MAPRPSQKHQQQAQQQRPSHVLPRSSNLTSGSGDHLGGDTISLSHLSSPSSSNSLEAAWAMSAGPSRSSSFQTAAPSPSPSQISSALQSESQNGRRAPPSFEADAGKKFHSGQTQLRSTNALSGNAIGSGSFAAGQAPGAWWGNQSPAGLSAHSGLPPQPYASEVQSHGNLGHPMQNHTSAAKQQTSGQRPAAPYTTPVKAESSPFSMSGNQGGTVLGFEPSTPPIQPATIKTESLSASTPSGQPHGSRMALGLPTDAPPSFVSPAQLSSQPLNQSRGFQSVNPGATGPKPNSSPAFMHAPGQFGMHGSAAAILESPDPLNLFAMQEPGGYHPSAFYGDPSAAGSPRPSQKRKIGSGPPRGHASAKTKHENEEQETKKRKKKRQPIPGQFAEPRSSQSIVEVVVPSSQNSQSRAKVKAEPSHEQGRQQELYVEVPPLSDPSQSWRQQTPVKSIHQAKMRLQTPEPVLDSDSEQDADGSDWDDLNLLENWGTPSHPASNPLLAAPRGAGRVSNGPVKTSSRKGKLDEQVVWSGET